MAKTLLDLMYEADAVQIDDTFIRFFYMEHEFDEDEEDPVVCHIESEQDQCLYEYFLTRKQLEEAEYDKQRNEWVVDNRDCMFIVPYKLYEAK